MNETCYGHPTEIKKVCEWTGKEFVVDWKHRGRRFIDKQAMYEWRKAQNREMVKCLTCGNPFERYKTAKHWRNGEKPSYCSVDCCVRSVKRIDAARQWTINNQPMNNPSSVEKIKKSKLAAYGVSYYNNVPKQRQTMLDRYGVPCAFFLPQCKSNGKRVSGFQKKVFVEIVKQHPDAELEKYLPDAQKFVDIYIPSIRKVVECHGDYWHCNPSKCAPDYYNRLVHLTAQEIWDRDKQKEDLLKNKGYSVGVVWENSNKQFKHVIEC